MKTGSVLIHQALYGYSDRKGHGLMASSVRLPADDGRTLEFLSDYSATGKFDPFITVFPLEILGAHAVVCTWSAPEMSRPGCVWSHALIIQHDRLATLEDLGVVLEMFRRPDTKKKYFKDDYKDPLDVRNDAFARNHIDLPLAASLMESLYSSTGEFRLVTRKDASVINQTVFGFWSQQWPRLRRSMSFVIGASQSRRGRFDFQVICGNAEDVSDQILMSDWRATAILDLQWPGYLRSFLSEVGVEVLNGRTKFPDLVRIFDAINNDTNEAVQQISTSFESANEAKRLKLKVLGPVDDIDRETNRLSNLMMVENAAPWSTLQTSIFERIQKLWSVDMDKAAAIAVAAVHRLPQLFAIDIVAATARCAKVSELLLIAKRDKQALEVLMTKDAAFLCEPMLWRALDEQASGLARSILHASNVPLIHLPSILEAIIIARVPNTAQLVVRLFPDQFFEIIFDQAAVLHWIDEPWFAEWIQACRLGQSAFLRFLATNRGQKASVIAALILDPLDPEVIQNDWGWIDAISSHLSEEQRLIVAAFFFAIGIQMTNTDGHHLIVHSFDVLHEAQARSRLPSKAWNLIAPVVPFVDVDWDRCKRLRNAVIKVSKEQDWTPEMVRMVTKDDGVMKQLVW
jgi:GTPase-associated protein 1, N-terminal domain type 1